MMGDGREQFERGMTALKRLAAADADAQAALMLLLAGVEHGEKRRERGPSRAMQDSIGRRNDSIRALVRSLWPDLSARASSAELARAARRYGRRYVYDLAAGRVPPTEPNATIYRILQNHERFPSEASLQKILNSSDLQK